MADEDEQQPDETQAPDTEEAADSGADEGAEGAENARKDASGRVLNEWEVSPEGSEDSDSDEG